MDWRSDWRSKITRLQPSAHGLTDVGSLRRHLAEERGLQPWQLRLECGSRELFDDREALSAVDATVRATRRGANGAGGAPKRAAEPLSPSVLPDTTRLRGEGGAAEPTSPSLAEDGEAAQQPEAVAQAGEAVQQPEAVAQAGTPLKTENEAFNANELKAENEAAAELLTLMPRAHEMVTEMGKKMKATATCLEANATCFEDFKAQHKALKVRCDAQKAEIDTLKAEKRARKSVEATLPEGRTWTFAEQYVLLPGAESLVSLVGEKFDAMPDAPRVCVEKSGLSLFLHDADRGYVSDSTMTDRLLGRLLTSVRGAASAVSFDRMKPDDWDDLDKVMQNNVNRARSIAGKITLESVSAALISHLRFRPANVLSLDTEPGILNLAGSKVATYDFATGVLALVDRDPDRHLVSRTTGVDCTWLAPELESFQEAQYAAFQYAKLNRWIVDPEVRQYLLCAVGAALLGGDTTRIKSSLLVIGGPDQGKTALLNAIVAAGGWRAGAGGSAVDTSSGYSYGGADSKSLLGKASMGTARSGVLAIGNGLRLVSFTELESGSVWPGVKTLANAEPQSITSKKQSSGAVSVQSVNTPYVLLSCNLEKRPLPPPADVKTKVAVITPAMLGRFVDTDEEADGKTTFKKEQHLDCSDDAVGLSASRIAILPRHPFAPPLVLTARLAPNVAGSDAACHDGGAAGARRGAPGRAV